MRFAVHYATVGDTMIAVGDAPPYATIVVPGKSARPERPDEEFDSETDMEDEVVHAGPRAKSRIVRTRRQLEALKPGNVATVKTKFGFLDLLREGDTFLIMSGGLGSIFARQARGRGAEVLMIPVTDLAALRYEFFKFELEPQMALAEVYARVPDRFRSIPEHDERMTELRILHRARQAVVGDYRRPAEQRMNHTMEDLALLAPSEKRETEARATWAAHMLMRRPMERLAADEERLRTLAMLLEQVKEKAALVAEFKLPPGFASCQKDITRSIKSLEGERHGMEKNPISHQARLAEKELAERIGTALDRTPIWHNLFSQVPGMGPLIAAMVISEIYTIDRFATPHRLANYAGWGFDRKTNQRQRRRRGHVFGVNENLKQAFFLWVDGIVKSGRNIVVRAGHPLAIGDKVRLEGVNYVKDAAGHPVSAIKNEELVVALEKFSDALADVCRESDADPEEVALLEALVQELKTRGEAGEVTVQIATVASNRWREYYDLKRRNLLTTHPVPVKVMRTVRVRTDDGPKMVEKEFLAYTPEWIYRTACAKTVTQLIDYLWTAWTKLEAPEVYRAWHTPREEKWKAAQERGFAPVAPVVSVSP